jgi:hypothetical protein
MAEKLTDRTAKTSNFADGDLVHVVDVSDTSQDPAGSSFKSTIGNIYGSYLAPKITSAQIVTNAADTYSVTLADTVSSNHFLFLQTASGDPFVDVTVTSYSNPKDGAILVMKLNRAGTDDLTIPGFSAGTGFGSGIYTARYSTSLASWLPVNYLPLTAVTDLQSAYDGGNTINGYNIVFDDVDANIILSNVIPLSGIANTFVGLYAGNDSQGDNNVCIGNGAGAENEGNDLIAFSAAGNGNTGNNVVAIGNGAGNLNQLSNSFIIGNNQLPTYADHAAAAAAITVVLGGSADSTYLYHNQSTNSIGAVRL